MQHLLLTRNQTPAQHTDAFCRHQVHRRRVDLLGVVVKKQREGNQAVELRMVYFAGGIEGHQVAGRTNPGGGTGGWDLDMEVGPSSGI